MFHVALIYTCNIKENALASCISYVRSHRIESGVGAWYGVFTCVGEWVMSLYFGRRTVNISRFKNIKRNVINVCWVEQEGDC